MDNKRLNEIKELISGGLVRDVAAIRQAWIEYGALLLKCPFKWRAEIGAWVREQGLDFVKDNNDRAAAKKLAGSTSGTFLMLKDCPYSSPTSILQWIRRQNKPAAETSTEPVATGSPEKADGMNLANTTRDIRNAMGELSRIYKSTGKHPRLVAQDSKSTGAQGAGMVTVLGGETYGGAIYRKPDGGEKLDGSGTMLGYAKVLRYRLVVEEADAEVWDNVEGISGWVTVLRTDTIRAVK